MIICHPVALRSMAHHQLRIKSLSPRSLKASQYEREPRNYHLFRFFLLLLLMLSAGGSVLRLATSTSSFFSSSMQPSDRFFAETGKDSASQKTHISSNMDHIQAGEEKGGTISLPCSALIDGSSSISTDEGLLCCDRSHQRTDVCYMRGDIRTHSHSSSILLYGARRGKTVEAIRPYTRKWETEIMSTIDELTLRPMPAEVSGGNNESRCSVHHGVPGIVFSTGGYTGNVYHEFNDGLIPLFITAQRFGGEVVLVVLEYHSWWLTKYGSVVKKLTNYKLVDFSEDRRVHCFSEMIVGLKIHGELTIDPQLMPNGKGIHDFQALLNQGFGSKQPNPQQQGLPPALLQLPSSHTTHPKLAIFIRNRSRVLQNLQEIVKTCERIGFQVQILNPKRTTQLSEIYTALDSADAMLAVHGAAMTHFLFMRPGSVLIQIVPLGLDWAADAYYGEPAQKMGLDYMAYKVAPEESSLYKEYDPRNQVLRDPSAITSKGWSETKRIYLDRQNVRVNLRRFSKLITKAHSRIIHRLHARM